VDFRSLGIRSDDNAARSVTLRYICLFFKDLRYICHLRDRSSPMISHETISSLQTLKQSLHSKRGAPMFRLQSQIFFNHATVAKESLSPPIIRSSAPAEVAMATDGRGRQTGRRMGNGFLEQWRLKNNRAGALEQGMYEWLYDRWSATGTRRESMGKTRSRLVREIFLKMILQHFRCYLTINV
jgi:hypothetical protein